MDPKKEITETDYDIFIYFWLFNGYDRFDTGFDVFLKGFQVY